MTGKRRKQISGNPGGNPGRAAPELAFDPIEAALRQLHDDVAAEGIPDDFMRLLDRLDDAPARRKPN